MNLFVDEITTRHGIETMREVLQHPGGAAVIPVLPSGNVLLVRQFRYPIQEYLLELPAGKIDGGESPEVTARRELAEEVGFAAGRLTEVVRCYTTPGFCDEDLHIYLAEDLTPVPRQLDEDEDLEIVEVSLAEMRQLVVSGGIRDAKTILGIQHLLVHSR